MWTSDEDIESVKALGGGQFITDLAGAITEMSSMAVTTGRKSSVSVSVSIEPKGEMVILETQITSKPPAGDKASSMYYVIGGRLQKSDPRQAHMEVRVIDGRPELRSVDSMPATERKVE